MWQWVFEPTGWVMISNVASITIAKFISALIKKDLIRISWIHLILLSQGKSLHGSSKAWKSCLIVIYQSIQGKDSNFFRAGRPRFLTHVSYQNDVFPVVVTCFPLLTQVPSWIVQPVAQGVLLLKLGRMNLILTEAEVHITIKKYFQKLCNIFKV